MSLRRRLHAHGQPVPGSLQALSLEWLQALRTNHYAPATVKTKGAYLRVFVTWCEERGITRPGEVTREVLTQHQRWLYQYRTKQGKPLAFFSQHGRLVALRVFFRWLSRNHRILFNPAADLDLPRMPWGRLPKNVLSAAEVERVIAQPDVSTRLGLRDRAMLEVLYSTGMRRHELLALELGDVDWEKGTVFIRKGKGGRDRVVPVGERALTWLGKYVADVRDAVCWDPGNQHLFLSSSGNTLGLNSLSYVISEYVRDAGIEKRGACHLLRHAAATVMLEGGADVRYIQEMLGHKHLTTTQIYTHVSIGKLKEVHDQTHPAARLCKPTAATDTEETTDAAEGEES